MMPEKTFDELMEALQPPKKETRADRRRKQLGWATCPICEKKKKLQKNGVCLRCNRLASPKITVRPRLG